MKKTLIAEDNLATCHQVVTKLRADRLDLIKMDTEGGERHVLLVAWQTIRRFMPRGRRSALTTYH
jgi:hypothetical protein